MKHLATIQFEFLKLARKWDDLSLEEQKGYLSRHPKTKRRITAKPEQSRDNESLPEKSTVEMSSSLAERKMQRGLVVKIKNKYYKLDDNGKLWSSKFESTNWTVDEAQEIPQGSGTIEIIGPQLQTFTKTDNAFFKTTKPIPAWVQTGYAPSNEFYGNAQIQKAIYDRKILPEGTPILILVGGDFVGPMDKRQKVRFTDPAADPGLFEKNYAYDATKVQLPLSALATTTPSGQIIKKPVKMELPPLQKKDEKKPSELLKMLYPKVYPKEEAPKQPVKEQQQEPKNVVSQATNFMKNLSFTGKDESNVDISRSADGVSVRSISKSFRYLGNWISRPGEEDDDYPELDRDSYNKLKQQFTDKVKAQPWFDEKTMTLQVIPQEKSWLDFQITFNSSEKLESIEQKIEKPIESKTEPKAELKPQQVVRPAKSMTKSQLMNLLKEAFIDEPSYSNKKGGFVFKRGYFYRLGGSPQKLAESVKAKTTALGLTPKIVDTSDNWHAWPKDSWFEAVVSFDQMKSKEE
jgi:hypothetical protein